MHDVVLELSNKVVAVVSDRVAPAVKLVVLEVSFEEVSVAGILFTMSFTGRGVNFVVVATF